MAFFFLLSLLADHGVGHKWILSKVHPTTYWWRWLSERFCGRILITLWRDFSCGYFYTYMSICQMKRPYSLYVKIMILSETIFFSVPSFLFSVLISERQHVIDVASLTTRNLSFFLDCGIISLVSFLIYLFYFLILGFAFKSSALKRSREQVRLLERKVICRFF